MGRPGHAPSGTGSLVPTRRLPRAETFCRCAISSLHDDDLAKIKKSWTPYMHRWVNEVSIGRREPVITTTKHYSMGRYSIGPVLEPTSPTTPTPASPRCLPRANDLSSGELFAMKVKQTSAKGVGAGKFDVEWVSLGKASNGGPS